MMFQLFEVLRTYKNFCARLLWRKSSYTTYVTLYSARHIVILHDEKSTCNFWANSAERPGICANRNQIRLNPGTIGRIRLKVACEIFEL